MYRLVLQGGALVTTAEAKAHLHIEHASDDALIDRLIASATRYVEKRTGRQLSTTAAQWELHLDAFPSGAIEIRKCPVTAVSEIAYTDTDGNPATVASFQTDLISEPARVAPAYDETWPDTRNVLNAVTVKFMAGYAPEEAKQLVLLIVGHWFANREAQGMPKALEFAVDALAESIKWGL